MYNYGEGTPFLPYVAPHSSHIPQIQFCFSLSWLEVSRIDFAEVPEGQGEKLKYKYIHIFMYYPIVASESITSL